MRLWSLHPSLLDARGLVALWREGLLAQQVLLGRTRGYRHHPQLNRFRDCGEPLFAIRAYLKAVLQEALDRGYCFDGSKIRGRCTRRKLPVTRGQMEFEFKRLLMKTRKRDQRRHRDLLGIIKIPPHPLFRVKAGEIETWEKGARPSAWPQPALGRTPRPGPGRRRPGSRAR